MLNGENTLIAIALHFMMGNKHIISRTSSARSFISF